MPMPTLWGVALPLSNPLYRVAPTPLYTPLHGGIVMVKVMVVVMMLVTNFPSEKDVQTATDRNMACIYVQHSRA